MASNDVEVSVINSVDEFKKILDDEPPFPSGTARIKKQFLVENTDVVFSRQREQENLLSVANDGDINASPPKQPRLSKSQKKKGQNKNRPRPTKYSFSARLCPSLIDVAEGEAVKACTYKNCSYQHNVEEFLKKKSTFKEKSCYLYDTYGRCQWGLACHFSTDHITTCLQNKVARINAEIDQLQIISNIVDKDVIIQLRKRKYDFSRSEGIVRDFNAKQAVIKNGVATATETTAACNMEPSITSAQQNHAADSHSISGAVTDEDIIRLRKAEMKKIAWDDKLYLAPLTTVGNLPFRRICKEFGADITCSEMTMGTNILNGAKQEWALVKRHRSEDIFGVQLCGNNPYVMSKSSQILQDQISMDFIDINVGCPIDLVYQQGAGCGLMRRDRQLYSIVKCMSDVVDVPVTVKMRTGLYTGKNIAHELIPKCFEWGASLVSLHGRTREQRYTKTADWEYIDRCAKLAAPYPVFGGGDILSFEDMNLCKENTSVSGVMIARGALMKPWIFTEIKEQRHWDISSMERLDIIKKYSNYGLEHWGSDLQGVETTRRFLLEWLSFLYRYIPVGLLEVLPQKINHRPPKYQGRDELETIMSSANCFDWVKISEMILGPVPSDFVFLPKHKANSWK